MRGYNERWGRKESNEMRDVHRNMMRAAAGKGRRREGSEVQYMANHALQNALVL
jgi:hypothetical protein